MNGLVGGGANAHFSEFPKHLYRGAGAETDSLSEKDAVEIRNTGYPAHGAIAHNANEERILRNIGYQDDYVHADNPKADPPAVESAAPAPSDPALEAAAEPAKTEGFE